MKPFLVRIFHKLNCATNVEQLPAAAKTRNDENNDAFFCFNFYCVKIAIHCHMANGFSAIFADCHENHVASLTRSSLRSKYTRLSRNWVRKTKSNITWSYRHVDNHFDNGYLGEVRPKFLLFLKVQTVTNAESISRTDPELCHFIYDGILCTLAPRSSIHTIDLGGPLASNGQLVDMAAWYDPVQSGLPRFSHFLLLGMDSKGIRCYRRIEKASKLRSMCENCYSEDCWCSLSIAFENFSTVIYANKKVMVHAATVSYGCE